MRVKVYSPPKLIGFVCGALLYLLWGSWQLALAFLIGGIVGSLKVEFK